MSPVEAQLDSVFTPVYNRGDLLTWCTESISTPELPEFPASASGGR